MISSFNALGEYPTGLVWDGSHLWNADTSSENIYELDPSSGEVLSSFDSPVDLPTGLAWDENYLWTADDDSDKI